MMTFSTRRATGSLLLLLAAFFARSIHTAREKAFTYDEPHYAATGLYLWHTGDYRWLSVLSAHPPLTFHLASLPLLAPGTDPVPPQHNAGFRLLERPADELARLRLLSRVPFVILACWGAVLVFLWAREVTGPAAGLLAALLYTCCPMVLAHAPLVHSDITVTVLYVQTLYTLWRWDRAPSPARLALCGVSLGLALLAKLSALLLAPTVALVVVGRTIGGRPVLRRLPAAAIHLGTLLALAVVVLWLGYGGSFATTPEPGEPHADLPLPGYVRALLFDVEANTTPRRTFLLGAFSERGWWYYFPVAFLVKTPTAMLALFLLAVFSPPFSSTASIRLGAVPLLAAAIHAAAACLWLDVPLGLRYLLPLYPLMHVFIATRLAPHRSDFRRVLTVAACAALITAGASIHPHYLAYFNALVGGPVKGPEYLLESNLDWGQDLTTLARYLRNRGNPPVHIAYFGRERPETYGLQVLPLTGCEPVRGLVAISVNVLHGLYAPRIMERPVPGCYDWLAGYEPVARPGYSILVYEIDDP